MPKQKDKDRAKRILDELMQDDIYRTLDDEVRKLSVQIDSITQSMRFAMRFAMRFENIQEYYSASAKIKKLSILRDQNKSLMKERKKVILLINGIL